MHLPDIEAAIIHHVLGPKPDQIDAACRHLVRRTILDTVACGIAGRYEPASEIAARYCALSNLRSGGATVWSDGTRLPADMAAWRNGIEAHVLDFDDVTAPMRGHPSVAILPALLALAQGRGLALSALEAAYSAGFDILCKMSRAVAIDHYAKGWHSTATLGTLAGVLAASRLIGLDAAQTQNALGIALAQLAGSRGNFGTMSKSLQAGQAGLVVVRSVELAEAGFDGGHAPLSGDQGFLRLYTDGGSFAGMMDDIATAPPELIRSGIEVKKYPLCYATHRSIDAVLDLLADTDLRFDQVDSVAVHCSHGAFVPLIHDHPQTGLEGKFSIQYAMAAALRDGHVRLSSFTDDAVQRPEIQAMMPKVRVTEAPGGVLPRWAEVTLTLRDGRHFTRRADQLRGSADLPLSDEELASKARDCFAFGKSTRAESFIQALFASADPKVADLLGTVSPDHG